MLEPMMRVSLKFLVCCLRVCRTVDPAGTLVCWAPIVSRPADYCNMPFVLPVTPSHRTPATRRSRRPPASLPPSPCALHFRHSGGAAGEPDIAILVRVPRRSRETPRTCRSTQPLEALDRPVRSDLFTFLHVNYPLSLSLTASRHI